MPDTLGEVILRHPDEAQEAAKKIKALAADVKVWLFYGPMGVGKTTLIKAVCKSWGVTDTVSSPTFALVNEYQDAEHQIFYHFDFYRINNEEEAWDIGTEDYFYSGNYCFVEWPERIEGLLPENFIRIDMVLEADQSRRIYLSKHE
ncbi:tRNA (adenosine(37)-N6)-threonylcarbamoyltransferase complex ATPase subunit type 1 TsaE [Catalinimonas niigatensis]|uniref:tRNA (adenosine(37)-N6)-threonylcarbamoyltransferase complex ATPase subunit type 1 TsaE n=1 Tax=Catalinimonas niigatensis TaxID=1397264 RepID=UPI00266548A6|nr:tRNA (adenosine(37)-N6)-threonylcarbamoyltransferase complex ATPase subunit type 1 TsaE [Catalinimonas niigatensis]WPP48519.1 tRNA (adenosine(37)-N6)-threonylcarbamoyltransferase complex ATPase subunit type 1 TsaE [Catalinimonas niigatensis]